MVRIGKYVVRGLLGRGGMGKVLRVEIPVIGRIAALKLLEPRETLVDLVGMARLRELFTAEAVTMANIRHPHICQVFEFGEDRGRLFYLMDYHCNNLGLVIGETYDPEAPTRRIGVDKALGYACQTLSGIQRLHHAGIVHRDIKPFNLLLTDEDAIRICDFGLSRVRGERLAVPRSLKIGTPCYAAPEQERDPDRAEEPADLFAVGVVFYRMLTGHLPGDPPVPASRRNPDLDGEWDAFFERLLDRNPDRRFPGAAAALEALEHLQERWRRTLGDVCRLTEPAPPPRPVPPTGDLRKTPVKTGHRDNRRRLGLDDLWRPDRYLENHFVHLGAGLVEDRATDRIWQTGATPYPVGWHEAHEAVACLNRNRFGGRNHWRLPTVSELVSLLRPAPAGEDYCLEPVFPTHQRSLWSADRRAYTTAWYVSLESGYVAWQDMACRHHVKAVCSA